MPQVPQLRIERPFTPAEAQAGGLEPAEDGFFGDAGHWLVGIESDRGFIPIGRVAFFRFGADPDGALGVQDETDVPDAQLAAELGVPQ